MGLDAGSIDLLKIINGHTKVHITHALDGQTNGVFTGIEHTILTGAVILEQQQAVAIFQSINILGLAGVHESHNSYLQIDKKDGLVAGTGRGSAAEKGRKSLCFFIFYCRHFSLSFQEKNEKMQGKIYLVSGRAEKIFFPWTQSCGILKLP
jgi:hypothetical protein